jgi:hypothetical protein
LSKQGAESVAAVGELPLLFTGDFGEGEVEGGDEEEGIVAETIYASWGAEEVALGIALGAKQDLAVACQREVADEAGCAGGLVLHEVEKEGIVAMVPGGGKYRGLSTALRSSRDNGVLRRGCGRGGRIRVGRFSRDDGYL